MCITSPNAFFAVPITYNPIHTEFILMGLVSAIQHLNDITKMENPGICRPATAKRMSGNGHAMLFFYPCEKCFRIHAVRDVFNRAKNEEIALNRCVFKPDYDTQPRCMRDALQ
jgi:hypothetical protein